ncbi:MAG: hypothetical protein E6I84_10665 [Chloroflexi bacterium]|nr:MAG: hypothetical protein E6I84_10665 [Chloroflexota bacterium]
MSRQLKRQISRANAGRGAIASSARPPRARSRAERLNRILLIGGSGLAIGAILLAVLTRRFDALAINLAAIAIGLVMGKGIGMFIFRRTLPTGHK